MHILKPKFWLLAIVGTCLSFSLFGQNSEQIKENNATIFSIGAGISPFCIAEQPQMENTLLPFIAFLEVGKENSPGSILAHTTIHHQFVQSEYTLQSSFMNLSYKYSFVKGFNLSCKNIDLFALAGAGVAFTKFSIEGLPGIVEYEYLNQKSEKPAYNLGFGSEYSLGNFNLSAMLLYLSSRGEYHTGQLEKQRVYSGSYQVSLSLSYTFNIN